MPIWQTAIFILKMIIYNPKPIEIIRLSILKKDEKTEYVNFIKVKHNECIEKVKELLINQNLDQFQRGPSTRIDFRHCVGSENGKSVSISFKGINPSEVKKLLTQNFKNK